MRRPVKYLNKIIYFFHIWGGPGGALRRTQVNENFRAVRPHNRADKCITREKINDQFFIYGHLYQSTYKIWKQSDKDFLSYRENEEASTDAAA